MAETVSSLQRLAIQFGAVFWFALLLFGLLGLGVVDVLPWWMIALVVVAGVLLGAMTYLPRWLIKRGNPAFSPKLTFLRHAFAGILLAMGLAALPFYYITYWVNSGPASVPLASLSNGKKTVIFQGMQHVAAEDFYKSVVFDLEKALSEGYTLFYEGIQPVPGRPDLDEWFNKTLRGTSTNLNAGYTDLAKTCGLTFQLAYFQPLVADMPNRPSQHVTADVSYLEMKAEYDRLIQSDPSFATAMAAHRAKEAKGGDDRMMSMLSALSNASREQKRLVSILCRGVMALVVSGSLDKDNPTEKIILDLRNRALARFVEQSTSDKIYITYGAAHLPGFFEALKTLDPAFKMQSVRWVRPMVIQSEPVAASNWPANLLRAPN